jgi:hypothetical protein
MRRGVPKKLDAGKLEVINPDVSCLICYKTFERYESLLQHINALGHARSLQ